MAKTATFPDLEQWLCDVLNPGVPVGTAPPNPRPERFVTVLVTGGPGRTSRVSETATIVIDSYAATETAALALANTCRQQLAELEGDETAGVHVKTVVENGRPGNLPHPSIPGARYTQSLDIGIRGANA